MKKENYIEKVNKIFKNDKKVKDIFIKQIDLFFEANKNYQKPQSQYKLGDFVELKKGTFLHGAKHVINKFKNLGDINDIKNDGIISIDFIYEYNQNKKTPLCASMWNIQYNMTLREYIELYSGATVTFKIGDGKQEKIKLVKYGDLDKVIEEFKTSNYWRWSAEQTKECRFMPCLSNNKVDVAFIFNMDNDYAKELVKKDVFNLKTMEESVVRSFISEWFCDNFIYTKRTPLTTDRESAILFGVPKCFIEGLLVSKEIENKKEIINELKNNFPDCYIANLDGKVIK